MYVYIYIYMYMYMYIYRLWDLINTGFNKIKGQDSLSCFQRYICR